MMWVKSASVRLTAFACAVVASGVELSLLLLLLLSSLSMPLILSLLLLLTVVVTRAVIVFMKIYE